MTMTRFAKYSILFLVLLLATSVLTIPVSAHHSSATTLSSQPKTANHQGWSVQNHTNWHDLNGQYNGCNWNWSETDFAHHDWKSEDHNTWHTQNGLHGTCDWDWASEESNHEAWSNDYHNQWHSSYSSSTHCSSYYSSKSTSSSTEPYRSNSNYSRHGCGR